MKEIKIGRLNKGIFRWVFPVAGLMLLGGCASVAPSGSVKSLIASGGASNIKMLEEKVYGEEGRIKDDVALTDLLELGAVDAFMDRSEKSNEVLESAYKKYTGREERAKINARGVSANAIDILFGEGSSEYEMAPFEKIYLHTLKALNYLMMGDRGAARVECQRAIDRHQLIKEYAEFQSAQVKKGKTQAEKDLSDVNSEQHTASSGKGAKAGAIALSPQYKELADKYALSSHLKERIKNVRNSYENAFTYLLTALILSLNEEFENTGPQLRNACNLTENRCLKDFLSKYRNNSNCLVSDPNVYVFAQSGFAPEKQNLQVPFYNPISKTVCQFAIAKVEPGDPHVSSIELKGGGQQVLGTLNLLTDLDVLALKQYEEDLPQNVTKAVLRITIQTLRDRMLVKKAEKKGGSAEWATKLGLSIFNVAVARADARSWTMAPKRVWFFAGRVHEPNFNIIVKGPKGDAIGSRAISIDPERLNVVSLRFINKVSYIQTASFEKKSQELQPLPQAVGEIKPKKLQIQIVWKYVNIRSGPAKTYKVIGKARYGDRLWFTVKKGKWYAVEMPDNSVGYIFQEAAKVQEDAEKK